MIKKFPLLFIVFIFLIFPCFGDVKEDAFYALSSLRSLMDQYEEADTEEIPFSADTVNKLWEIALKYSESRAIVKKARRAFEATLFCDAEKHLYKAWRNLHPDIPKVFEKGMQKRIAPFLMSLSHPARPALDSIFSYGRSTTNEHTLVEHGFHILFSQSTTHIIVASHSLVTGYLMKLYLDIEDRILGGLPGWEWFARRCEGAKNIRTLIKRKKLKYFSVPDKSIYVVPKHFPSYKDQTILVVTDMQLTTYEETCHAWYHLVTKAQLDELYCILSHGYSSAFLVCNVPLTKSGKFACVDTEHPKRKINYSHAKKYLNPEMGAYWDRLVGNAGKRKS